MALTAAQLLNAEQSPEAVLATLSENAIANQTLVLSWPPGYPPTTLFYATSRTIAPFTGSLDLIANSSFRSTAKGSWLDLVSTE